MRNISAPLNLPRSHSADAPSAPRRDEAYRCWDELAGERREARREAAWTGWAAAVRGVLGRPAPSLPGLRTQALADDAGRCAAVDLEELEPITLGTFREGLNASLREGRPAMVAVVSSAGRQHATYEHLFAGDVWCRLAEASGVDLVEFGVQDALPDLLAPVSRLPVTYLTLHLWSRGALCFQPIFDRVATPAGSAAAAVARALTRVAVEPQSPTAWAELGWTLATPAGGGLPRPPDGPPPRDMAERLLPVAAKTGDAELARRCLALWQAPHLLETAARWSAWAGDAAASAQFERLGVHVPADDFARDQFEEARRRDAEVRPEIVAQTLRALAAPAPRRWPGW